MVTGRANVKKTDSLGLGIEMDISRLYTSQPSMERPCLLGIGIDLDIRT